MGEPLKLELKFEFAVRPESGEIKNIFAPSPLYSGERVGVRGFALVQSVVARERQGCCDSNERERMEELLLVAAMGELITVGFAHGRGCVATFVAD